MYTTLPHQADEIICVNCFDWYPLVASVRCRNILMSASSWLHGERSVISTGTDEMRFSFVETWIHKTAVLSSLLPPVSFSASKSKSRSSLDRRSFKSLDLSEYLFLIPRHQTHHIDMRD